MKNKLNLKQRLQQTPISNHQLKPMPAKINIARRQANRALNTERLLALLRKETPSFFELAEVVGKWVWIQFEGNSRDHHQRIVRAWLSLEQQTPVLAAPLRMFS